MTQALLASTATLQESAASPRQLYYGLLGECVGSNERLAGCHYLQEMLDATAARQADFPTDPGALPGWVESNAAKVGREYQAYLQERRSGAARRYFNTRAHALYYLRIIAPTKLVDGAWLYGLLRHWDDPRFYALVRTYLQELGEGRRERNHVAIYRRLLAAQGCDIRDQLNERYYIQGAIQLALAYNSERFLPELIGYNLGYEQPPLHMMISAFELKELGIDPLYFSLHVTIDNADSGHAAQAARSVLEAWPLLGDRSTFYHRVLKGYRLNALGPGAQQMLESFDLKQEVVAMLQRKSKAGRFAHCDCQHIGERSVTQWLAQPRRIPAFLDSLQAQGWIRRHQAPHHSRFWRLVHGKRAAMHGVFNAYELQLLHDWIAGDHLDELAKPGAYSSALPSPQKGSDASRDHCACANDFNRDVQLLAERLGHSPTQATGMNLLADYMSPARHHSAVGLWATRAYSERLG